MLKNSFTHLAGLFSKDQKLIQQLWTEIEDNYGESHRHYHSLKHLENLLYHLGSVKEYIIDWNTILFTLFYHDIIYSPLKSDNEEKSAVLAQKRMNELSVPIDYSVACKAQILATKSHKASEDSDTNYFTDADLSILGQSWEEYSTYFRNVRKEYSIYPDLVYKPGRKKVLSHFLEMDRIFKTNFFFDKFEVQAKRNIKQELAGL